MAGSFCDGVTRRDALRIGTASLFGSALGLPQLLRAAEGAGRAAPKRDVSLIFVFLHGGQSHLDTFDFKPNSATPSSFAPANIGGINFPAGYLPKLAGQLPNLAIVRSMSAWALVHSIAQTWWQIGRNLDQAVLDDTVGGDHHDKGAARPQIDELDMLERGIGLGRQHDASAARQSR